MTVEELVELLSTMDPDKSIVILNGVVRTGTQKIQVTECVDCVMISNEE